MKWSNAMVLSLGLFLNTALARGEGKDDKGDLKKLQGTWKLVTVEWAEADSRKMIFLSSKHLCVIKGNRMTLRDENGDKVRETKYRFTLDATKKPRVYRRTFLEGKMKGKIGAGIYSIAGDTLLLCSKGKGLPKDFVIRQGQEVKDKYLYTYKRVKK
jgi:uncharacterized protein (TIGR03067 family)